MKNLSFLLLIPFGMMLGSCGDFSQAMAQAYGNAYLSSQQTGSFYYPVPQYNLKPKFDFSNINTTTGGSAVTTVPTGTSSSSTGSGNSGSGSAPKYTKTCGVCHGTGTCNICGGDGWVTPLSGKDHYCSSCRNHDGRCTSCNGRGTWKE